MRFEFFEKINMLKIILTATYSDVFLLAKHECNIIWTKIEPDIRH